MPRTYQATGHSCIGPDDLDLTVSFTVSEYAQTRWEPGFSEVNHLSYELDGTPVFRSELADRFGLDQADAAISAAIENAEEYDDC